MSSDPHYPIAKLYKELAALKNLAPSKKVNRLFTKLVRFVLDPRSVNTLAAKEVRALQIICQKAEYELEKHWAEKIIRSAHPEKTLARFPYLENYRKLAHMEWFSLLSCTTHATHGIFFAGGGPLPLTAIMLAREYGQKITVADISDEACSLSKKAVQALGLEKQIRVLKADASEYGAYGRHNVVVIAALAGLEKGAKEKILLNIKKSAPRGAHILARSSWGAREILYRPIEKKLYGVFKPLMEVRPQSDIINSVVIFLNS